LSNLNTLLFKYDFQHLLELIKIDLSMSVDFLYQHLQFLIHLFVRLWVQVTKQPLDFVKTYAFVFVSVEHIEGGLKVFGAEERTLVGSDRAEFRKLNVPVLVYVS
jgi:hypothetical protein